MSLPNVAIYCRLSSDDEREGESNSIINQKEMLKKFASEKGLHHTEFYVDDGISGTTFNRPDFIRMMNDVDKGIVDTIIVKDMSRFGRDYLEVGRYLELVFPAKGIRFIAVSDGVDSAHGDNEFVPFRNIMNEWYAKDTSKKVKNSMKQKARRGEYLTTQPPYGYKKDTVQTDASAVPKRAAWIVDEEAAGVVKYIFQLSISGLGISQIAKRLHTENVLSPSVYKTRAGLPNSRQQPIDPCFWSPEIVRNILTRMEYLGHMVNGRCSVQSYKTKKRIENPKEEWLIFENTHEAIIEKVIFDKVQKLLETRKRNVVRIEDKPLFSGILKCADCGGTLYFLRGKSTKAGNESYCCSSYRRRTTDCTTHYVRQSILEKIVMDDIHALMGYINYDEMQFRSVVLETSQKQFDSELSRQRRALIEANSRYDAINRIIKNLYEDKGSGVISNERFLMLMEQYEKEQKTLKAVIDENQSLLDGNVDRSTGVRKFISLMKKHNGFKQLDKTILNELIDKIVVHEKRLVDGKKTQRIELHYSFGVGMIPLSSNSAGEAVQKKTA